MPPSRYDPVDRLETLLPAALLIPLVALSAILPTGCITGQTWRDAWKAARRPDRELRLAGAQIPVEIVEGIALRCPDVSFDIRRVGKIRFSHDGFRALAKGQANVACTSNKIAWYDAKDYLDAHGNLPLGYRIAWDAYAVYVHPENPVRAITVKQLREVLRGQIKSWSVLGGPREPITLYGPTRSSRAGRIFMQAAKLMLADPPWKQIAEPGDIIDGVKTTPWALGMTEVGYAEATPYLALSGTFDPEPRIPTPETLEADKWPVMKTIWLWTTDPPDAAATALVDYLYSDRGRRAIESVGYIPVTREQGEVRVTIQDLPKEQTGEQE